MHRLADLVRDITACRQCAAQFAATAPGHAPRPVLRVSARARILIAGQAPGMRVHRSGLPFDDPSGARLRDWLGLDRDRFYDPDLVAFVPTAFCFPGYDARKADLPPPPICAQTWHPQLMPLLTGLRVQVLVGGHAHRLHLGTRAGVTETVRAWRAHAPARFCLPHPSWRNTSWLKRHPWFEQELLPALRARIGEIVDDRTDPA